MKKAEDFRKAFGPATPGFETVVKKTIKELRAQEIKPVVKEWRRWRRPVFAMAMALVLFVGFVAVSGTLNPFNRQDRIRSEEENLYTAQPITTVLSMGAGQEEGDGDGAESGTSEGGMYSAANIDESVQRSLMWFFETWVQDPERVKMGCTPEWRESTDREEVLQAILADRTPLSYQINSISGQDGDPVRDAVCTLEMEKGRFERFTIALVKDEYESYDIDPEGLKRGDPVEADSFTKTVAMSEEGFISARLDLEVPGLSDKLFPVNLVCEKNGLRVEVISGYVSGTECQFVISMEDLEGKYDDSMVFPTFACDMAGFSGYSAGTVYTDKKKHKTVYLYTPNLSNPDLTEDRIITAGIDTVHMETLKDIDLLPMLGQYGKTVEGVKQPSQLKLAGTANKFPPKDMKFLDYTQPLDIPLFGDVCLSGIGWIDGQLHVQYHNTGAVSYSKGSVTYNNTWSVWEYGTAGMPAYSPVEWDADLDGYGEWEEFIYDLSPEETDGLELGATIKLLDKVLNDGWMVEIPLELICPDVLKMDPEIEERLNGFMNRWSTQDYDGMLTLCDPEWQANTEDARQALEDLTQSATLLENRYKKITGTAEDTLRTVTCATNIQRPGNKLHTSFQLDIEVKKAADGLWYINPESLRIWTVTEDIRVEPVETGPIEELDEDFGNMNLDEREEKLVFDAYAQAKVYTKDSIGYVLKEDGTAESVKTSTCMPFRDEIIIPERVRDYIVTAIGTRTFDGYDVKSLTLPDTVKTISKGAFSDCTNLVYFRIPDGVSSIEDEVFYDCVSMTDVIIPDSVTEIGSEAFYNCRSLTAAGIPERTVSIGSYAFLGCDGLTSITLPDTLEILGAYTFSRCNGLESVEIPGGVTSVEKGSFKDCTGLKAVRLKEGIAEIGEDAFSGCGALETVELPASLLTIGDRAFRECGSMKQLVLPDGLTFIGRAAFMNCTGLEEIVIPESVTTIELHAFRGCTNLTCVVKDGSYAKDYCEGNGIPYVLK